MGKVLNRSCVHCGKCFTCEGSCQDITRVDCLEFCFCPDCFKKSLYLLGDPDREKCDLLPLECSLRIIVRNEDEKQRKADKEASNQDTK